MNDEQTKSTGTPNDDSQVETGSQDLKSSDLPAAEQSEPEHGATGTSEPTASTTEDISRPSDASAKSTRSIQIGTQRSGETVDTAPKPTETLGVPIAPQKQIDDKPSFPPPRVDRITPDLQEEIDAAIGDISLDELLSESNSSSAVSDTIELDSRIPANVVKVHRDLVFFSLGANNEGIASLKQFAEPPEVGTRMEVIPVKFIADEGLYELIVPGASVEVSDWSDLAEGVVVEVTVTGHNKGGLECEINNIRGFIPASQISVYRVDDFEEFVGQKLQCVVTEANPERQNLVLSHRAVLEREKAEAREKTMAELEVGQIREGTITKLMDFGVFVDIGGVDGLIHISQLSWDRIKHPSEVVAEGDRVKVRIEKIDPATGKIGLSYRDQLVNPWDAIDTKYPVGAIVKGTVSKLMDFGAFVKLEPGVEGLVHISELAHHRVHRVSNVVNEGDEVEVKVLSVEPESQKIGLSIKAAQAAPPQEATADAEEAQDETPSRVVQKADPKTLKGGTNRSSGGEQFGLKW